MTQPVESFDCFVEDIKKLKPVGVLEEDHHPLVTSAYDMVECTFELNP